MNLLRRTCADNHFNPPPNEFHSGINCKLKYLTDLKVNYCETQGCSESLKINNHQKTFSFVNDFFQRHDAQNDDLVGDTPSSLGKVT